MLRSGVSFTGVNVALAPAATRFGLTGAATLLRQRVGAIISLSRDRPNRCSISRAPCEDAEQIQIRVRQELLDDLEPARVRQSLHLGLVEQMHIAIPNPAAFPIE